MAYIEPLAMETWFVNVLSGDPTIFVVLALLVIASMGGYFRMNGIALFFMIALFTFMFASFNNPIMYFLMIFGALFVAYTVARLFGE